MAQFPDFETIISVGGIIAHRMLSLSLVWEFFAAAFGQERMVDAVMDVRYVQPERDSDFVAPAARELVCRQVMTAAPVLKRKLAQGR